MVVAGLLEGLDDKPRALVVLDVGSDLSDHLWGAKGVEVVVLDLHAGEGGGGGGGGDRDQQSGGGSSIDGTIIGGMAGGSAASPPPLLSLPTDHEPHHRTWKYCPISMRMSLATLVASSSLMPAMIMPQRTGR